MAITEDDLRRMRLRLRPVLGLKAWGVSLGIGSFITASFGKPVTQGKGTGREFVFGEWYLWVQYCPWTIRYADKTIAESEDPRDQLRRAVQRIEGRGLLAIEIAPATLGTTFSFDGGLELRLGPDLSEDGEYWKMFTPHGQVVMVGPGLSWSVVSASG